MTRVTRLRLFWACYLRLTAARREKEREIYVRETR